MRAVVAEYSSELQAMYSLRHDRDNGRSLVCMIIIHCTQISKQSGKLTALDFYEEH